MYTIRFPTRLEKQLEPIFAEQGLMEQATWDGDQIVVQLDELQAVALKLRLIDSRLGPIGGWKRYHDSADYTCCAADRPQTKPPRGMDFS